MLLGDLAAIGQGLSTSGKGAGARPGEWSLYVVESGDIDDDNVRLDGLRTVDVKQSARTEKHLLRPLDVLVTARSHSIKAALVPPRVARTVAASTLLVVRPLFPETGMAHFLWYYLTSKHGRAAVEARVAAGATVPSLAAAALAGLDVPLPTAAELHLLASFIEASEEAYASAVSAARLRRETLRDSIIARIAARNTVNAED